MGKPEHVEESEHGRMCRHCCGSVDESGYALGEQEQFTPFEGEQTEQQSSTIAMRDNAGADFARAVKGYAGGGVVEDVDQDEWINMGDHQIKREDMADEDWTKAQALAKSTGARRKEAAIKSAPDAMRPAIEAEREREMREMRDKKRARYAMAFGGPR